MTAQGRLYLTDIIDLADRKLVGRSLCRSMKKVDTTIPAFIMAVRNWPVTLKLIFHSDLGIQYACNEFRGWLEGYTLVERSMSRKGDCWDNAVAVSFFKSLKVEWVYQYKYKTRMEAAVSIFEYMEAKYNTRRFHTTLKMLFRDYEEKQFIKQLIALPVVQD